MTHPLLMKSLKRCACCWKLRPQFKWLVMCSSAVLFVLIVVSLKMIRHYPSPNHLKISPKNTLQITWLSHQPYIAPTSITFSVQNRTKNERHERLVPYFKLDGHENRSFEVLMKRGIVAQASDKIPHDTKIILWSVPTRYFPKLSRLHPLRSCPEKSCRLTTNRYFHNQSDAVIFAVQLLPVDPPEKLPNQVWTLHNHESPRWDKAIEDRLNLYTEKWNSKFNWTMDYREDADLKTPYGLFKKRRNTFEKRWPPVVKNYTDILSRKLTKPNATVAWMVSHCVSMGKRHKYVAELSRYIKVDIFGGCGTKHCPRADDWKCFEYLSSHYKFYLSFENAFCKDYITEKMFRFYKSDMVIVVRGGGNYSRVTPPGTYINTADFRSPKHLAGYLNMLNVVDSAYLDILKEKDKYVPMFEEWPTVKNGQITFMNYRHEAASLCQLCDRLHNLDKFKNHYKNITTWFKKGVCYVPKDI